MGLVLPPARAGTGGQGRARVAAGECCNPAPLCPAKQKGKASCRNPSSSVAAPQVCGAGCGLFLLLLLLLPARTMRRAPAVLPGAGLEPAPLMARSTPQPPAAASDIPLLCQAMKISPTGLEQLSGRERLANIPSPRKALTTALGGVTIPGMSLNYSR